MSDEIKKIIDKFSHSDEQLDNSIGFGYVQFHELIATAEEKDYSIIHVTMEMLTQSIHQLRKMNHLSEDDILEMAKKCCSVPEGSPLSR